MMFLKEFGYVIRQKRSFVKRAVLPAFRGEKRASASASREIVGINQGPNAKSWENVLLHRNAVRLTEHIRRVNSLRGAYNFSSGMSLNCGL
jgi:hypothetical protein